MTATHWVRRRGTQHDIRLELAHGEAGVVAFFAGRASSPALPPPVMEHSTTKYFMCRFAVSRWPPPLPKARPGETWAHGGSGIRQGLPGVICKRSDLRTQDERARNRFSARDSTQAKSQACTPHQDSGRCNGQESQRPFHADDNDNNDNVALRAMVHTDSEGK